MKLTLGIALGLGASIIWALYGRYWIRWLFTHNDL